MATLHLTTPRSAQTSARSTNALTWHVTALVIGTVVFNALLAFANTHIHINSAAVILCEASIDAAALGVVLLSPKRTDLRAFYVIALIFIINMLNALGSLIFDPKLLRDVLIIPMFVLLGQTSDRGTLIKILIPLQWIVFIVMMFEAVRPEEFGRILDVMSYYINTRGFEETNFWNQDQSTADLFVSATRPNERFLFASLNIHRLSSVFLEPVSLGNYCVIVTLISVALWEQLSRYQRVFLIITNALILIGCDGRFATVNIFIMIMLKFVAPKLPRYFNFSYLPITLVSATVIVIAFGLAPGGDDFPTRTAGTIYALSNMTLSDLFGMDTGYAYQVMDSGIAYLLYSQSLIGALLIWTFIAFGLRQTDRPSIIFSHGTSAYVALNLLISYSMFSIKTAGLLWFAYGAIGQLNVETLKKPTKRNELETSSLSGRETI